MLDLYSHPSFTLTSLCFSWKASRVPPPCFLILFLNTECVTLTSDLWPSSSCRVFPFPPPPSPLALFQKPSWGLTPPTPRGSRDERSGALCLAALPLALRYLCWESRWEKHRHDGNKKAVSGKDWLSLSLSALLYLVSSPISFSFPHRSPQLSVPIHWCRSPYTVICTINGVWREGRRGETEVCVCVCVCVYEGWSWSHSSCRSPWVKLRCAGGQKGAGLGCWHLDQRAPVHGDLSSVGWDLNVKIFNGSLQRDRYRLKPERSLQLPFWTGCGPDLIQPQRSRHTVSCVKRGYDAWMCFTVFGGKVFVMFNFAVKAL